MNTSIAAALFCLCCDLACAQCTAASAGSFSMRGVELIKTASAVMQHDDAQALAVPSNAAGMQRSAVADAPGSSQADGRMLVLTGLALIAGIALRRHITGSR